MLRTYWYDTVVPLRELTSLQQWMDQTLQATLNSFAQTPQVATNTAFVPRAEVFETDGRHSVKYAQNFRRRSSWMCSGRRVEAPTMLM